MRYDFDYSSFFGHNILVYKLFGFWKPDDGMKWQTLYNFYTLTCVVFWVTFLLSQATYLYLHIQNVAEVTATLYITITFTVDLIKMIAIYINLDSIKELIKNLNNPLFQVKCERHMQIAKDAKRLNQMAFYLCVYLGLQTDLFWFVLPFLGNERTTIARGWFPYDWDKPMNYELTYVFQNVVHLWNTMLCLNLDTFTANLLINVGLQCDLLCVTLNSLEQFHVDDGVLCENTNDVTRGGNFCQIMTENLVVCVQHHREIMRLAKNIEKIHRASVFILFTGGALVICSCLFQLSMVSIYSLECVMLLFYFVCMLTEQLLYCWFGNEVIFKSSRILQAAYNTPWVDCDIKFRKILLQFMTQTKKPISLLAGGLFQMSISVFISVLRTSYSYYTLLQRIQ